MDPSSGSQGLARSDVFEVDLRSGELCKPGFKIRLQDKPLQILTLLLEHPGEVVTREELQKRLWTDDIFVDFEHGINTAVKRLRAALGDDAGHARYIETLPRHGYRFLVPVRPLTPNLFPNGRGEQSDKLAAEVSKPKTRRYLLWAAALLLTAIMVATGIWFLQSGNENSEAPMAPVPLTTYPKR